MTSKKSIIDNRINTYYWTKVNYNLYRLIGFHTTKEFKSYTELYQYCTNLNIDAKQI